MQINKNWPQGANLYGRYNLLPVVGKNISLDACYSIIFPIDLIIKLYSFDGN
ncbi:MAG: hypothetical protein PHF44_02910 [Candidatus Pacebacteria bacterium]|nr:hypothetical protein [Candidatus Paceibacterota bacterium]